MWNDSGGVVVVGDIGDGSGGAFRSFQSFRQAPHGVWPISQRHNCLVTMDSSQLLSLRLPLW